MILGAGFDTRPYRLPEADQVKVFEIDLPAVQNDKKKSIQKHLGRLPENVTFIPIDFETQTLEAVFAGTAFDPTSPAVFIWEGVTPYISEKAVGQTLSFVGTSAPGSIIVFTYILKSVIERRSQITDANKGFHCRPGPLDFRPGTSRPPGLFEALSPGLVSRRWECGLPKKYLQPLKRKLKVFEGERVAQAIVIK